MNKQNWFSPVNVGVLFLVVVLGAGFVVGRFVSSSGSPSDTAQEVAAATPSPTTVLSAGEQAASFFTQARANYDSEDYEAALRNFTAALDLSPRYAMAYLFRGLTYAHLGDNDRAIQDLNTYLEISSDNINRPEVEDLIRRLESESP